jgi:peptide alpha-N-acetyltransferase
VPDHDPEQSDLLLYHVRILEDMGDLADALALLGTKEKSKAIVDQVAVMETRGTVQRFVRHTLIDLLA